MKHLLASAAAVALLAACSSTGADRGTSGAGTAAATMSASDYVSMAGASDLYEIQSSQTLLQTTQQANLRHFAQMMIDDHTKTSEEVMTAARSAGMTPPAPQLDARKTDMLQALQSASGTARDRLYVQQQVTAHQDALTLHRGYERNGDRPALRNVAGRVVPIVERHLAEIQRISEGMGRLSQNRVPAAGQGGR